MSQIFGESFCAGSQIQWPEGKRVHCNYGSLLDHIQLSENTVTSTVIRDPRDIIVSGFYYHQWCKETWCLKKDIMYQKSYQDHLNSLDTNDGLILEIVKFNERFRRMMRFIPYIEHVIRYENIFNNEQKALEPLLDTWNLNDDLREKAKWAIDKFSFAKIKNQMNNNHARKGVPGQWHDHFKENHIKLFKTIYPNFVENLGYKW